MFRVEQNTTSSAMVEDDDDNETQDKVINALGMGNKARSYSPKTYCKTERTAFCGRRAYKEQVYRRASPWSQFNNVEDFLPFTSIKSFCSRRAHKKQVAEPLKDNEEEDKHEEEQLQDDQEDEDEQDDEDDQREAVVVLEILHDLKKVINYSQFRKLHYRSGVLQDGASDARSTRHPTFQRV